MSETVLVYKGPEIAAYGFGDPHPFGFDRHDVFHAELDKAGLDAISISVIRAPRSWMNWRSFTPPSTSTRCRGCRPSGKGWLDDGDTPA